MVTGKGGTGKTTVLVEVIRRAAVRGESVLASAPSNLAVDNLVERLAAAGLDPVRIGHPARVLPAVLEHTLEARVREHEEAKLEEGVRLVHRQLAAALEREGLTEIPIGSSSLTSRSAARVELAAVKRRVTGNRRMQAR